MSILSLAHACIKTSSLEKTLAFYCDGLGMKKHFEFTRGGQLFGYYFKASNATFVEVFLAEAVENTDRRCLNHFCLETEDIQGLRQRLVEHGYEPGEVKMGADKTWQFWINDPNGLAIEFQQYTSESAQYTGANVEVNW